jgi:hypothetical protein
MRIIFGVKMKAALLTLLGAILLSCKPANIESISKSTSSKEGVWLGDWSSSDRYTWYSTSQGSHVIPWEIFNQLEDSKTGKPMRQVLDQYGFIYPETKPRVNELPFGLVKDVSQLNGKAYLGFTCAACHTGEITFKGEKRLIDGGQPFLSFDMFMRDLKKNFENGLANNKFKTVNSKDLNQAYDYIKSYNSRNLPTHDFGPSRLDAITAILNEVVGNALGYNENIRLAEVPVSLPQIWDAPNLECVQTNCLSKNPLTRNIGEVLGVFGSIDLQKGDFLPNVIKGDIDLPGFISNEKFFKNSAKVENLYKLEESLRSLKSPVWDQKFLGELNKEKIDNGRNLFSINCAGCHAPLEKDASGNYLLGKHNQTEPNMYGKRRIKVTRVDYKTVGTDDHFMKIHGTRKAKPGILRTVGRKVLKKYREEGRPLPEALLPLEGNDPQVTALSLLGLTTEVSKSKYFKLNNVPEARQIEMMGSREPSTDFNATTYRARPLNGIVFTAPYLHNGSVPNLWEMLKSPEDRVKEFWVGNREYNPQLAGYVSDKKLDPRAVKLNTIKVGNSNVGHPYGTSLSDEDKWSLIEYLKSM